MNQHELEVHVEELIDSNGLRGLLEIIETVCFGKAEHLRSNWQDEKAAKVWEKAGTKIGLAIVHARNLGL